MSAIKHVTNTWLFAQLLYPLVGFIYYGLMDDTSFQDLLIVFIIFSFVFSFPAYVLCILALKFVEQIKISSSAKFYIWIILVILCVYIGASMLFVLLFQASWPSGVHIFTIPGYIAAALSVLFRKSNFHRLIKSKEVQ